MEAEIHITHSRLLESIQGADLQPQESRHIATCEDCALSLHWLRTMGNVPGLDYFAEPPPAVFDASIDLARPYRRAPGQSQAVLTFDSFTAPLPPGIRPGHSDVRHLVYKGWLLEITLRVNTNSTSMTIVGQLSAGPDHQIVPHACVRLLHDRDKIETYSDESGQFIFEAIPTRAYSCEVNYHDISMAIDQVPPPPVEII